MKNTLLLLLVFGALTTATPARAECPSDDEGFCVAYEYAQRGNVDAQFDLGMMYATGNGIAQDKREAKHWWGKATEQDVDLQIELGLIHEYGYRDVTQDKGEAVRWYRKAAEQGHWYAQYQLGLMYENGEGITQDAGEAMRWYRTAAEQGDIRAQNKLDAMYANGAAVRWYRTAAEQGDASAQNELGVIYENGEGVAEDEREAYIWYSIAESNGDEDAADSLRNNEWNLTNAEIESARLEVVQRLEAIDQFIKQGKADSE